MSANCLVVLIGVYSITAMYPSKNSFAQSGSHAPKFILLLVSVLMLFSCVPVLFFTPQVVAQSQDGKIKADQLLQQGLEQYQASKFAAAKQFWQQALKIYREIEDRRGEGQALGNLGITFRAIGEYNKAIEYQLQALAIYQELKDRKAEGQVAGNLGNAYAAIGEYDKAVKYHQQSLTIAREIKDRQGEEVALENLGIVTGW